MKELLLSLKIAYKYFRSKKSIQAIHYISYISSFAVIVLSSAMIILLSVFNGFESLLSSLYQGFYPPVKVVPAKSKWLDLSPEQIQDIRAVEGVEHLSLCAEDMILIFKEDVQKVAVLKGVEDDWFEVNEFDSFIISGVPDFRPVNAHLHPAIIGLNIANEIGIRINDPFSYTEIYYPREYQESHNLEQSLNKIDIIPASEFAVQAEIDSRYILVPLRSAQELFDNGGKISSIELSTSGHPDKVIRGIQKIVGNAALVQSQYEQNKTIYMVMRLEKLATYIILTFILIIASFTLVGVISMMAIDKKKDLNILKAMGLPTSAVQKVLVIYGALLSFFGGLVGLVIGLFICWGQIQFGWLKMSDGFIVETYPVKVDTADVVIVLVIVMAVGIIASLLPAIRIKKLPMAFQED